MNPTRFTYQFVNGDNAFTISPLTIKTLAGPPIEVYVFQQHGAEAAVIGTADELCTAITRLYSPHLALSHTHDAFGIEWFVVESTVCHVCAGWILPADDTLMMVDATGVHAHHSQCVPGANWCAACGLQHDAVLHCPFVGAT